MKKHVFLFILIFVSAVFFRPFFVFSETEAGGNKEEIDELNKQINDKKNKVKELEKTINDYKLKIEKTKLEATSLANQLSILDNYLTQLDLDIQITQEKIDTTALEIKELDFSIEDKEQNLAKQQKMLRGLIRTLYYENNKKYIEVMAAYDNFSEFYNRVHYVQNLEREMGKSAKTLRIIKEELEAKKQQREDQQKSYLALKETLDNKKKDLEEQANYKQNLLVKTKSSEMTFNTLVKNLKGEYQSLENDITSIESQVRRKLEAQNKISNTGDTSSLLPLAWPTQSRYITAYFYDKNYPYRNIFEHNAIDIRAAQGTAVRVAASGYVARARTCSTASCYGYVMIVHSDGFSTVYGHLSSIPVVADQFVTRGDIVGYSGATPGTVGAGPFTTGPHLHMEVRKNGIPVNPLNYLAQDY
ncbi:MAG: peptidoglycan DD-metalloendopeptidase family protein [Candidatus Magasanikbacteria bacterium]